MTNHENDDDYYTRLQSMIDLLNNEEDEIAEDEEEDSQISESESADDEQEEKETKEKNFEEEEEKRHERFTKALKTVDKQKEIAKEFEKQLGEFVHDYPESHEAIFLIGRQAFMNRSFSVAWESFNKAWSLDQTILEYADAIAITSSHLGKMKEGAFFAKLSLVLEPHPVLKKLTIKVLTDYKRSLLQTYASSSNFHSILQPLALGSYTKVINILESEVEINNKHAPSYYYLGFSYYQLGDLHLALENIRTAYLLEEDNLKYLPLLAEVCLRLHMYEEAHGYICQLESHDSYRVIAQVLQQKYVIMNNAHDNADSLTANIWNNIEHIEEVYKHTSKQLPNYVVTPYTKVYARVGVMINSSTPNRTIHALINSPDNFHVVFYDVDDAKARERSALEYNVTDYRNLYETHAVTSAMIMRGEGLDVLLDTTNYSTNGSYNNYAFDDVAPIKLSWLAHLEKPFIDGILYSDNHNKLDKYFQIAKKKPYKIRNAVSLPLPHTMTTTNTPPAFENGYITLGVMATQENLTPLFLSQLATILRKISFVNIHFGYNPLLTETYKDKLVNYFAGLKLHTRISFTEVPADYDAAKEFDYRTNFSESIDLFLNGAKTSIDALGYALYSGVPCFCLLDGSGESVIAVSTLSSAQADENRVCDNIDHCISEILKIIEDPTTLETIRTTLIQTIPTTLLFNKNTMMTTFWEDIYTITQSSNTPYSKI